MSKESYIRGFCKAASANGVNPKKLFSLYKKAYNQEDLDQYLKILNGAGNEAEQYLTDVQKTQPLPSVDDIDRMRTIATGSDINSKAVQEEIQKRMRDVNPMWYDRVNTFLNQNSIPRQEEVNDKGKLMPRAVSAGSGLRNKRYPIGNIQENFLRGAWPALTNALQYGSSPARPKEQQVVPKK